MRTTPSSKFHFVEIDNKSNGNIEQFHVTQQLSLVNRQNFPHGFQFQQQTIFNQNIKAKRFLKHQTLVFDLDEALIDGRQGHAESNSRIMHFS